jgi:hypothetical protein
MYVTILHYGMKNEVLTYELPSYCAKFECADMEEYISQNLGFSLSNCDWQVHEELPEIIHLHEQEYA